MAGEIHHQGTKGQHRGFVIQWSLLASCIWLVASWVVQADQKQFDNANKLFEQGQYEESIEQYQSLLDTGVQTAAVHFNLGNAWFRQGNIGQSVFHYLMAQALDPLDPDIRANLRFARDSAGLPSGGIVSPLYQWIRKVSLNVWATIALAPLWIFCFLKAIGIYKPKLAEKTEFVRAMAGWVTVPGIILLGLIAWMVQSHHPGVIIQDKAELHASPFTDSKVLLEMKAGEEVMLMAVKNEWQQVRNSNGDLGWVESSKLHSIPIQ